MIRGITFDKQLMKSQDHAHEVNYYYQGDMGVTKGCAVTKNVDGNLVVADGYFIVYGRLINVQGSEIITVPVVASGALYSILVFEIDLTKVNTTTEFLQGSFKIVSNSVAYPTLTQQDLSASGTVYQMEFARFQNTVGGAVSLVDTKIALDMVKYQPTLVSGTNIKTINGEAILGSGNVAVSNAKNQIINGNFQVNQRAKSGTVVLTVGQYGHDRFKAGASGCTYTFATVENITTLTISAGSLIQVIEGLNLETDTYCLSWEGTSQGKIGGGSYGASGITGSVVGGTNLNVEFNTGTLRKVSLVKGSLPSVFIVQPYADVLRDCLRYYQKSFPYSIAPANNLGGNGIQLSVIIGQEPQIWVNLKVSMYRAPTVTLYNPYAGTIGQWFGMAFNNGASANARVIESRSESFIIDNTDVTALATGWCEICWVADAEL